jgi:hypothetical protein
MTETKVGMSQGQENILLKMISHHPLTPRELSPKAIGHIFGNSKSLPAVINIIFNDFPTSE